VVMCLIKSLFDLVTIIELICKKKESAGIV
jgi:hypothetical protein